MAVPHLEVAYKSKWGAVLSEQINDMGESLENIKCRGIVNIYNVFCRNKKNFLKLGIKIYIIFHNMKER